MCVTANVYLQNLHVIAACLKKDLPDDGAEKCVESEIFSFEHLEKSGFGNWIVHINLSLLLKFPCYLIFLQNIIIMLKYMNWGRDCLQTKKVRRSWLNLEVSFVAPGDPLQLVQGLLGATLY